MQHFLYIHFPNNYVFVVKFSNFPLFSFVVSLLFVPLWSTHIFNISATKHQNSNYEKIEKNRWEKSGKKTQLRLFCVCLRSSTKNISFSGKDFHFRDVRVHISRYVCLEQINIFYPNHCSHQKQKKSKKCIYSLRIFILCRFLATKQNKKVHQSHT